VSEGEKQMDNKNQDVLDGLKLAIQAESDGHHFYLMAAQNTNDAKGKEVFESLAKDEIDHFNFLTAQYKAFLETGKPDPKLTLVKRIELNNNSPIFSDDFKKRLDKAHYEMSALSIGAQLELNAINFYKAQAEKTNNAVVKDFYKELADWESTHYQMLIHQQEEIQQDYWFQSKFYPF
jgi:rubrerythrin